MSSKDKKQEDIHIVLDKAGQKLIKKISLENNST